MAFEGLVPVTDTSVGLWIAQRLRGFGGRVYQVVPDGFDAYVRVLHPAEDERGRSVPWAEVCRRTGRTAHPLMQWSSIAAAGWERGMPPRVGEAPAAILGELLDVLTAFTPAGMTCYHALWEGWGWLHPGSWAVATSAAGDASSLSTPAATAADLPGCPRLELPGRSYLIFGGQLTAAKGIGHQVTANWFDPQSPSLLWPTDHSWCVATEVDFDSTLVGGSVELIDAIVRDCLLDAWPVQATDDLTSHGDTVNPPAGSAVNHPN